MNASLLRRLHIGLFAFLITAFLLPQSTLAAKPAEGAELTPTDQTVVTALMQQAQQQGAVNVIISLKVPYFPRNRATISASQPAIQQGRAALIADLAAYNVHIYAGTNWVFPALAVKVDVAALAHLRSSPLVAAISPDHVLSLADTASDNLIGVENAWGVGATGSGQAIAILDTGVQENHPFLGGRVLPVAEACFSGGGNPASSLCPNNETMQTGSGAAAPCTLAPCDHGTHVAGIAAGYGTFGGGPGFNGVAVQSDIVAVQVFSNVGGSAGAFDSDILSGLNWVYSLVPNLNIAAVNLSLGAPYSHYTSACDDVSPAMTTAISTLRAANVATVIASGNYATWNGAYQDGISYPACISSAISVGAVDDSDNVATFSQSGPNLTFLAPGVGVDSSIPVDNYAFLSGTSMAAPHVAGTFAIIRAWQPSLTVDQIISLLESTGKPLFDARNNTTTPRIQVDAAINSLSPTATETQTATLTPTTTASATSTATATSTDLNPTETDTETQVDTSTPTDAVSATGTDTPTSTPTATPTLTSTATSTATDIPTATQTAAILNPDTIGVYRNGLFLLRNSNTTGFADIAAIFNYGGQSYPVTGDWVGTGLDSIGLYTRGQFFLRNTNTSGTADEQFGMGDPGDEPIAGRWTINSSNDGAGIFRPSNGLLLLRNTLSTGFADYVMVFGIPGDQALANDWSGQGYDSPGVYRPTLQLFLLSNQVCSCTVSPDYTVVLGSQADEPMSGDWIAQGHAGIGVFRPDNGLILLKNQIATGYADIVLVFGIPNDVPVAGHWTGVTGSLRRQPPALIVTAHTPPTSPPVSNLGG